MSPGVFGAHLAPDAFFAEITQVTVAQIAPIVPYLLLVLILIFRPRGLFGTRET